LLNYYINLTTVSSFFESGHPENAYLMKTRVKDAKLMTFCEAINAFTKGTTPDTACDFQNQLVSDASGGIMIYSSTRTLREAQIEDLWGK